MIKVFCDSCGRECQTMGQFTEHRDQARSIAKKVEVPCHIAEQKLGQYIDLEGEAVSGRMVEFDLCAKCLNEFYSAAFKTIKK